MAYTKDMRSNQTRHFEVQVDGEFVGVEKCRDTLGGWSNLMDRVAAQLEVDRLRSSDRGETWTAGDRQVRFVEVSAR